MKHIKKLDISIDDNMDADDMGSRIASVVRCASTSSNFANLIRVKVSDKMPISNLTHILDQISKAFHNVGVTNCVVVPITDGHGIIDVTVTEVLSDLTDRVAFNDSKLHPSDEFICSNCGLITKENCRYEIDEDTEDETCYEFEIKYCPRCGRKIIEEN